tara:strand:- start:336 stop:1001 length:666 start_codon:yes stop_codon:yes gene_type:complete
MIRLNKKSAIASALFCSTCFSPLAIADIGSFEMPEDELEKGFYVTGSVGTGAMGDLDNTTSVTSQIYKFDSGLSAETGIGYDFGRVRTELTYNYLNSDMKSITAGSIDVGVDVNSWFFSAALDLRASKKWQPYIGFGLGTSDISFNDTKTVATGEPKPSVVQGSDNVSSYIGKLGLNYDMNDRVGLFGEAWIQGYGDFTIGNVTYRDALTNGANLGVRIKF